MANSEPIIEPYKGLGTAVNVLVGLLNGRMMASEVKKYSDYRTGLSKLRQFLDAGLVSVTVDPNWRRTNWYELTPKGRRVAELLAEAERIIEEE